MARVKFRGSRKINKHFESRKKRYARLVNEVGFGRYLDTFVVDRGHSDGLEFHVVYSSRIIEIYNAHTFEKITVIYARDNQLRRYYKPLPKYQFKDFRSGLHEI